MKKLTLGFMAFALMATTFFTSCSKDDDDTTDNDNTENTDGSSSDNSKISTLSATVKDGKFETSLAAFYGSSNSGASTSTLANLFGSSSTKTTIAGTSNGKQLAITIKDSESGTYELKVGSNTTTNQALIDLLSGETVKDVLSDAVSVKTDAMIIYRSTDETEGGSTYYFATEASVTVDFSLTLYATGSFTATLRNKAGDTFNITDGTFKVFGKPVTSSK